MADKVAIVTGASSGMGEAISRHLASLGWKIAMADIKPNDALSRDLGPSARFYHTDVASYSSQADAFSAVWRDFGRLDAACLNAGIVDRDSPYLVQHRGKGVEDIPPEPDMTCTDVDWKGVVYGTRLCVHFMRFNSPRGGNIVATASIAAVHPHESYPEYNGAKAAVLNWVRGTARVLKGKENIRINCVMPGIVHTPIIPQAMVDAVQAEFLTPVETITAAYQLLLEDETVNVSESLCHPVYDWVDASEHAYGMLWLTLTLLYNVRDLPLSVRPVGVCDSWKYIPSLTTSQLNGEAIEGSVDKQIFFEAPRVANGAATKRAVTVWDPLFESIHDEKSGLDDAIPGETLPKKA